MPPPRQYDCDDDDADEDGNATDDYDVDGGGGDDDDGDGDSNDADDGVGDSNDPHPPRTFICQNPLSLSPLPHQYVNDYKNDN